MFSPVACCFPYKAKDLIPHPSLCSSFNCIGAKYVSQFRCLATAECLAQSLFCSSYIRRVLVDGEE
jgi:hypothetical protein